MLRLSASYISELAAARAAVRASLALSSAFTVLYGCSDGEDEDRATSAAGGEAGEGLMVIGGAGPGDTSLAGAVSSGGAGGPPSRRIEGGSGEVASGGHGGEAQEGAASGGPAAEGGGTGSAGAPPGAVGAAGASEAGGSEPAPTVNGCVIFVDGTHPLAERVIPWDFSLGFAPGRCLSISVGQSVTWSGPLGTHPLQAAGGTTPSPILADYPPDATSHSIAFPVPGLYGYVCGNHSTMQGAIRVLE